MVVGPEPARGEVLDLVDRFEQVLPQPVIAYRAVIAFDVGVLLRLAGLDEVERDLVSVRRSPEIE